jgi:hypothetical protein
VTRNHPSLELSSNIKEWKNMELTSHPTRKGRYISLKQNPGPDKTKKSYVRKYIRKDPIRTRGELMEHFNLSEEDLKQIEEFLINHYKNKKS